ncbi:pentraxin-4 [Sphaeramia orbicularis]|uniref:pentraxin-4 n=1 Tax=Sphaeramia orbicularis TaxID=375764 RepID=UPI00117CCBCA|nr:pentraxin-4-like [Sphaeramia orbicularis]
MGGIRPVHWALILAHILLLQIQPIKVQGADPVSQKLRRLNEQFQQFQALTQARLDMLTLIQNRNSSGGLESRVQALNDHYHHMSHDLEHLKQSTTQELGSLREWNKKLEKKNKRMEGRMALIERNLRDNCRQFQKQKPDLGQDFSNLTLELQNQEERLAALQIQRDELLIGLKGLQDSLKKQELRVIQLEGRLTSAPDMTSADTCSIPSLRSSCRLKRGPYPVTQEQLLPKPYGATQHGVLQDRKTQVQLHPKPTKEICNVDSMLFFPSASEQNYVTFSLSLPNLPELSMCLWLRVDTSHVGTLLSYATHDNDNQLVLYGRNSSVSSTSFSASSSSSHLSYSSLFAPKSFPSLDFVIGDPVFRRLPISSLMDSRWHHLCVVWSSIQGRFWHYNNRRLASTGSDFRKGWEIPGGGSVVLGQEQDSVGGGFDRAEGFAGQMAGFRIWDRVLSPSEVEGVAEGRGVPRGVVLGMEDIKQVHGEVQQVACECLEHCL